MISDCILVYGYFGWIGKNGCIGLGCYLGFGLRFGVFFGDFFV